MFPHLQASFCLHPTGLTVCSGVKTPTQSEPKPGPGSWLRILQQKQDSAGLTDHTGARQHQDHEENLSERRREKTADARGDLKPCEVLFLAVLEGSQFWKVPSSNTFPRPSRNSAAVQMIRTRTDGRLNKIKEPLNAAASAAFIPDPQQRLRLRPTHIYARPWTQSVMTNKQTSTLMSAFNADLCSIIKSGPYRSAAPAPSDRKQI